MAIVASKINSQPSLSHAFLSVTQLLCNTEGEKYRANIPAQSLLPVPIPINRLVSTSRDQSPKAS